MKNNFKKSTETLEQVTEAEKLTITSTQIKQNIKEIDEGITEINSMLMFVSTLSKGFNSAKQLNKNLIASRANLKLLKKDLSDVLKKG